MGIFKPVGGKSKIIQMFDEAAGPSLDHAGSHWFGGHRSKYVVCLGGSKEHFGDIFIFGSVTVYICDT